MPSCTDILLLLRLVLGLSIAAIGLLVALIRFVFSTLKRRLENQSNVAGRRVDIFDFSTVVSRATLLQSLPTAVSGSKQYNAILTIRPLDASEGASLHASAVRVVIHHPRAHDADDLQTASAAKSVILKIWQPSTLKDAWAWALAAFELLLARLAASSTFGPRYGRCLKYGLRLFQRREDRHEREKNQNRSCGIIGQGSDFRSLLSRKAQYLASFDVEMSLYCGGADAGLGFFLHETRAPAQHGTITMEMLAALRNFLRFPAGTLKYSLGSAIILEDVCNNCDEAPRYLAPEQVPPGQWYNDEGFPRDIAVACLEQISLLHARFWSMNDHWSRADVHSRLCAALSGSEDEGNSDSNMPRIHSFSKKKVAFCRQDIDIWHEGGYWLGEKRRLPLFPDESVTEPVHSYGDSLLRWPLMKKPIAPPYRPRKGIRKRAVAAKWAEVEARHSSRWSTAFRMWVSRVSPGQILEDFANSNGSIDERIAALRPLTLIHGDFKVNNLFVIEQYASSPHIADDCSRYWDVRMIDWQWCGVGSAAADVAHFFCTSLHESVLFQPSALEGLVDAYFASLVEALKTRGENDKNGRDRKELPQRREFTNRRNDSHCEGQIGLDISEFRRQLALHVVRFVLDTICFKWSAMDPFEMDHNRVIHAHGLDRRHYTRMEAAICMATHFAEWISTVSIHCAPPKEGPCTNTEVNPFPGFIVTPPPLPLLT